jgi:DNA-binding PadR family transcriptional regulator
MAAPFNLGDLQQLTMLAVARLGDEAFGGAIQDELHKVAGREMSVSTIYVTLVRLEDQGLVESKRTLPDPSRGGKGKRFFNLTPKGWRALESSRNALARMWEGVNPA